MENSSNNITEQLVYLRRVTEMTGVLHEAQIQHLKVYWGILTEWTGKEFGVDFESKIVEFRIPETGHVNKAIFEPFFEGVNFILGKGWNYKFKKGEEYFDLF